MFRSLLRRFLPPEIHTPDFSRLKNSVCIVMGQRSDGFYFGNGVYLRRDLVLTCHHNISNMTRVYAVDASDNMHEMEVGSPFNHYSEPLDASIFKLTGQLDGEPVEIGEKTESFLQEMKGFLVAKYQGIPENIGPAEATPIGLMANTGVQETGLRVKFHSAQAVRPGYSGAPIFDSRGKLSSLVCSVTRDPQIVYGAQPQLLASFVRQVLSYDA